MKKLMTALAVCLAAGFVAATGGGVVSSNIVGYVNTSHESNKLFMLGSNFEKIGISGNSITFGSLVGSVGFEDLDNIQVGVANVTGGIDFTDFFYLGGMWVESDYTTPANDVEFPAGISVWLILNTAQKVTQSGQVRTGSTLFNFQANKLTLTSSAYPVPFNPNASSCVWSGLQDTDNIQVGVANASGGLDFTDYFYLGSQWVESDYTTTAGVIAPAGAGFWVLTQGDATLTQSSPL